MDTTGTSYRNIIPLVSNWHRPFDTFEWCLFPDQALLKALIVDEEVGIASRIHQINTTMKDPGRRPFEETRGNLESFTVDAFFWQRLDNNHARFPNFHRTFPSAANIHYSYTPPINVVLNVNALVLMRTGTLAFIAGAYLLDPARMQDIFMRGQAGQYLMALWAWEPQLGNQTLKVTRPSWLQSTVLSPFLNGPAPLPQLQPQFSQPSSGTPPPSAKLPATMTRAAQGMQFPLTPPPTIRMPVCVPAPSTSHAGPFESAVGETPSSVIREDGELPLPLSWAAFVHVIVWTLTMRRCMRVKSLTMSAEDDNDDLELAASGGHKHIPPRDPEPGAQAQEITEIKV